MCEALPFVCAAVYVRRPIILGLVVSLVCCVGCVGCVGWMSVVSRRTLPQFGSLQKAPAAGYPLPPLDITQQDVLTQLRQHHTLRLKVVDKLQRQDVDEETEPPVYQYFYIRQVGAGLITSVDVLHGVTLRRRDMSCTLVWRTLMLL